MKKKEVEIRDEFIRKRMERQKKIRKRRLITSFVFFIVLMICVGITLSLTVFFPIENIKANGSKIYSSEDIIKLCGIQKGDNLFVLSRSRIENSLKSTLPYIESVEIKRELPDTVKLTVKDAREFACYNVKNRYYTVSDSGWVLKETAELPENLTEIVIDGVKCKVGSQTIFSKERPKEIVDELLLELETEKLSVNRIDVSDTVEISVKIEGRFEVYLGTSNNLKEKIRHLRGMVEHIDASKTGAIDLSMWTSSNPEGTFVASKEGENTQTE